MTLFWTLNIQMWQNFSNIQHDNYLCKTDHSDADLLWQLIDISKYLKMLNKIFNRLSPRDQMRPDQPFQTDSSPSWYNSESTTVFVAQCNSLVSYDMIQFHSVLYLFSSFVLNNKILCVEVILKTICHKSVYFHVASPLNYKVW